MLLLGLNERKQRTNRDHERLLGEVGAAGHRTRPMAPLNATARPTQEPKELPSASDAHRVCVRRAAQCAGADAMGEHTPSLFQPGPWLLQESHALTKMHCRLCW